MSTILRIRSPDNLERDVAAGGAPPTGDSGKQYIERVVKLIPAEVVSVYLVGKAGILAAFAGGGDHSHDLFSERTYWIGWTAFCFLAVIAVRAWATSDSKANIQPEWPAVAIATVSFVIWVYSLGDAFKFIEISGREVWAPLLSMLIIFAWTLVVPLIYQEK